MPPRFAYWTILLGDEPTAFRAGSQEDLLPTLKRLQEKHPGARLMWFQNGKLWNSRVDAQEAMRVRGERGREGDRKQGGLPTDARRAKVGFRDRPRSPQPRDERPAWRPKSSTERPFSRPRTQDSGPLEWKPKGEFTPAPKRTARADWKPKSSSGDRQRKPAFRDRKPSFGDRDRKPAWKPKAGSSEKLEWKPKGSESSGSRPAAAGSREKRKWVPKEEFKKSQGIEARRDKNWRPGGEHKDPRQKYKDAKKAKWGRFKKAIRTRWESKQGKKPKGEE